MAHFAPQIAVKATYMRGGTSKGTFFKLDDLPERCQTPGQARDNFYCGWWVVQIRMVSKLTVWGMAHHQPPKW